jgi:hypothetical protein
LDVEWDSQLERIRLLPDKEKEAAWIWYVLLQVVILCGDRLLSDVRRDATIPKALIRL